jgi:hypothetical protein
MDIVSDTGGCGQLDGSAVQLPVKTAVSEVSGTGQKGEARRCTLRPMTRYFFDIHDGPNSSRDEDGEELATLEDAESEAVRALADLSRNRLRNGGKTKLVIDVRDDTGKVVLSTSLTFEVVRP